MKHSLLIIRIDTREQQPLELPAEYCESTRGALPFGDYALEAEAAAWRDGGPWPFAVERKSLADLVQSLIGKDETRKIGRARAAGLKRMMYLVEAHETDLLPQRECSCIHPRGSGRCPMCHGVGWYETPTHTRYRCDCVAPRPARGCPFCRGRGTVGYDYSRFINKGDQMARVVVARLWDWRMGLGVNVIFSGSREMSALYVVKAMQRRERELRLDVCKLTHPVPNAPHEPRRDSGVALDAVVGNSGGNDNG